MVGGSVGMSFFEVSVTLRGNGVFRGLESRRGVQGFNFWRRFRFLVEL